MTPDYDAKLADKSVEPDEISPAKVLCSAVRATAVRRIELMMRTSAGHGNPAFSQYDRFVAYRDIFVTLQRNILPLE